MGLKKMQKMRKKVLTRGNGCGIIIRRPTKGRGQRTLKIKQRERRTQIYLSTKVTFTKRLFGQKLTQVSVLRMSDLKL